MEPIVSRWAGLGTPALGWTLPVGAVKSATPEILVCLLQFLQSSAVPGTPHSPETGVPSFGSGCPNFAGSWRNSVRSAPLPALGARGLCHRCSVSAGAPCRGEGGTAAALFLLGVEGVFVCGFFKPVSLPKRCRVSRAATRAPTNGERAKLNGTWGTSSLWRGKSCAPPSLQVQLQAGDAGTSRLPGAERSQPTEQRRT